MKWAKGRAFILSTLLAIPVLFAGAFALAVAETPLPEPHNLEVSEILDASGLPITQLFTENRVEVPVVEIPQYLLDAVIAIEDDRFLQHRGIDPIGISRAMYRNLRARSIREGGSTLTQQLAKNLYLTNERTWTRKLKEAVFTVKLEQTYSKSEILGLYWNTIYLGRGAYGVEVASQTYFGKSVRDLTLGQAAFLAGLPRSPEFYGNDLEAAKARRDLVLSKMVAMGSITPEEADGAKQEPGPTPTTNTVHNEAPYFVDYVVKELRTRYPDIAEGLYKEGYRIQTTLDLPTQRAAEQAIATLGPESANGDQATLVALDPNTGYVRAFVGGREKRVKRNRALEGHQPGSVFKPFLYTSVIETRQYTAASTQLDKPAEFPGVTPSRPWKPQNFKGEYTNQPAGMRYALRKSLNVVAAQWMNTIKPEPVIKLAHRMGIESPLRDDLTLALGTSEVTPLELTAAYAPYANGGFKITPVAILRVTDRSGNVLVEQTSTRERVIDGGTAFIVTDLLKEVLRAGTASNVAGTLGGRPTAAKTGTTDNGRDAWTVGYTPDLVTSVWIGDDARRPSNERNGSATAAPIWARFMSQALAGKPHRDWSPPPNVTSVEFCSLTGLRPNATCPVMREWVLNGTEPKEVDPTIHWDRLPPELPGGPRTPPNPKKPEATSPPRFFFPRFPFPIPSPFTPRTPAQAPAPPPSPSPFRP